MLALPPATGIIIADLILAKSPTIEVWYQPIKIWDKPFGYDKFYGTLKEYEKQK